MVDAVLDTVFNGLLIGSTGCAMVLLGPFEHPFAFTASAIGFCHGCAGIYSRFFDCSEGSGKCKIFPKCITTACMEIVTVPLVNIDLYMHSQQSNALALGHGLFIIPLVFDFYFKIFPNEGDECESNQVLKDLTILGNIVSLLFFALNEDNLPAGIMAFAAFFAYYGSIMMENVFSGTGDNLSLAGYALFFGLLPLAIGSGGEAAK